LLTAGLLMVAALAHAAPVGSSGGRYICPPCGIPCDTLVFGAPGVCPVCGMKLLAEAEAAGQGPAQPARKRVAIVVFNGAEILDFTGPYEMFGAAGCDVYLVAEAMDPVTTAMGMTVVPRYTFADAPQPDVLLVPGGGVRAAQKNEAVLHYIRETTAHAQNTMSVCNGAFILASTGLLDGLTATTTNGNIPLMATTFPRVKVVRDQRVVDNGSSSPPPGSPPEWTARCT
jgi:putative intracellular protease/amidase